MQLEQVEINTLNKAQKSVDNWKWKRWVHITFVAVLLFLIVYLASDAQQIGTVGAFSGTLAGLYLRNIFSNWHGLKQELLLIKYFESTQDNTK
ncbi:hypothetical protein [Psychromonas sp. Urea-02u-13]|uniref:hypothetical protein n=1 Tax=Psychromonas sp. Urea-02u-13 TaxID=2058326 RepID=UPI000C32CE0C|nr:hypothetical protein [Psychromonas sp. Urea-02u-13]PKG37479.1 hypothetical protein CXF74_18570 [Psychromonas sp. Urea-02u-13]